jgi:hypothetical protein
MGVMGVAHDDVLHLHRWPGPTQKVVAELKPTADRVIATGRAWIVVGSIWYELTVGEARGWANATYLMYPGPTNDETATIIEQLGSTPAAKTMEALGLLVANHLAGNPDPGGGPEVPSIVLSVAPTVGDLGEVTYDIVGLPDDAAAGFRVHLLATQSESGGGFILRTAEVTEFCRRGFTNESCV